MRRPLLIALALAALAAAPVLARAEPDGGRPGARAGCWRGAGMARRMQMRRHAMRRLLLALDLTDAQKQALADARLAAQPVREAMGAQIRAAFEEARKGERTPETRKALREKIKAAIETARNAVQPSAVRLVGSLTAEQKQKAADLAKTRGVTLDDARLTKAFTRMLLAHPRRPGAVAGKTAK